MTALPWILRHLKISQFSRFLLTSEYADQVKIWKCLKLLYSFPFINKTLGNHLYIWIWSFWLTFTVLQWMKKNSKTSQFSSFPLRSVYAIYLKIWEWLKLLKSVPFIKRTLLNQVYIRIWSFWLTFTALQWVNTNLKLVNLIISAKVRVCNFGQNLKMTQAAWFCSIHQENTCKSCLHSNLIILTDFHSFTVNEEKLQN